VAELVIPIRLTADDLEAIASAVAAKLQPDLDSLIQGEQTVSAELDALTAQVQQVQQVDQSAIALINGLADQIKALANDPAAINALADQLKQQTDALAAAVTANTPAPPAPEPAPTP
jgi:ABC-type transporter Mla MlaB component